jgi:hypothetical protein
MKSRLRRLADLESRRVLAARTQETSLQSEDVEATRRGWLESSPHWQYMRTTMDSKHAELVERVVIEHGFGPLFKSGVPLGEASLAQHCMDAIDTEFDSSLAAGIAPEVCLSMPPAVAAVYLADPFAMTFHDCQDCGFAVPRAIGVDSWQGRPKEPYFPRCPLCGGETGSLAFYKNRQSRLGGSEANFSTEHTT